MLYSKFRRLIAGAVAVLATALAASLPIVVQAQALSDYVENNIVDRLFRAQAFTPSTSQYVFLSTAACSDSSVGTEATGTNYARAAYTASLTNWAATQGGTSASSGTGGQTSNLNAITFATPGSGGWGTVTHFGIIDSSSGAGNIIICQALTTSKTINSGDTVSFGVGAITVTIQ